MELNLIFEWPLSQRKLLTLRQGFSTWHKALPSELHLVPEELPLLSDVVLSNLQAMGWGSYSDLPPGSSGSWSSKAGVSKFF